MKPSFRPLSCLEVQPVAGSRCFSLRDTGQGMTSSEMPWNYGAQAVEGSLFLLHRKCRKSIFRLNGEHFCQKSDPSPELPVLALEYFKLSLLCKLRKHKGAKYSLTGTGPRVPGQCQAADSTWGCRAFLQMTRKSVSPSQGRAWTRMRLFKAFASQQHVRGHQEPQQWK